MTEVNGVEGRDIAEGGYVPHPPTKTDVKSMEGRDIAESCYVSQ